MKKTIISVLFSIISITVFFMLTWRLSAQNPGIVKGYCLTYQGDSLFGQININRAWDNTLKFRPSEEQNWKKLSPKEVKKAQGEGDFCVVSQEVNFNDTVETIFLHRIASGNHDLYEGRLTNIYSVFYISTDGKERRVKINPLGMMSQLRTDSRSHASS